MANLELFVLDMKFKSRWKMNSLYAVFGCFLLSFCCLQVCEASSKCGGSVCDFGRCINGTCVCDEGWTGSTCSHCVGRVRLTANQGFISDGTGNYSVDAKCAWLVDSGSTNHTIRLHLKEFATECGWDHIFIHDGDSAFSPLTAAYSGRMVPKKPSNPKEIQTETEVHSGKAYIHFYSDAAYNIAGFNISYRFGGCRKECSGHGVCANTTTAECECDAGWRGPGCDLVDCSQQCTSNATYCSPLCVCHHANKKSECEERERRGYWEPVFATSPPHPRTSHKAVVVGDHMWVVGGYNFNLQPFQNVVRYNFVDESWQSVTPGGEVLPEPRYGHSVVAYQGKLYMYGGVVGNTVTNALFVFNISSLTWSREDYTVVDGLWHLPAGVAGHTAHVVDDTMLVVFGHSPVYGYMPNIQEYDFRSHKWRVVTTTGALVSGAYGHSSMYDPVSGLLYVFGGSSPEDKTVRLTDKLFAYNHLKRHWTILQRSYSPRYLHSAVFLGGLMLVFGGNTHNDTSGIKMAKCYSVDLLAYDLGTGCDSWKFLPQPDAHTANKLARYGHTSVVYNNEVYIFAGFSGVMLNDLYRYTPGNCSLHDDKVACQTSVSGVKCHWQNGACQENSSKQCEISSDPSVNSRFCGELASCRDCLAAGRRLCYWCGDKCSAKKCPDQSQVAECPAESSHRCNVTQNCELCKTEENCIWSNSSKCQYAPSSNSVSVKPVGKACKPACQSHSNCGNCTAADCMWCTNLQRCVDTNSYSASFPYGICMEWTMNEGKCPQTKCSELRSCSDCQSNPRCGWCKDPRDTGLGACQEGGDSGDLGGTCPAHRWFFTSCPLCQCNGHSSCKNGTDICEACQSHTTGRNCERCKLGYFGDARLGGRCKPCECNGQADICATDTGDCFCRTKGMIGPRCDRCDEGNKYFGDPKSGTCYYDLATDYQYTFEMFKESDQFYTHINFMNIPIASDRDVDFRLNCSGKAMVNITWHSNSYPEEQMVMAPAMCGVVKRKFEHDAYNFDSSENTTFRIYVYDFKTPFSLQISFVVVSSFDIFLFVAIFIGCFLSLMLLAALLWKIKQRYDLYRRRQRMVVEMEQMASRPFAMVSAEIEPKIEAYINPAAMAIKRDPPDIKRKKLRIPNKPQPVAYEPLYGGKVAVVSLLVRLPTGDEDYTPPGQSGLAVASALVTLGTQRKPSIDKGDKSRTRNQRSTATQPHV